MKVIFHEGRFDMINTEIFEWESVNNYTCFEEVLKLVNDLIEKNNINKSDIIEYRTENWTNKETQIYYYRVTISWWQ